MFFVFPLRPTRKRPWSPQHLGRNIGPAAAIRQSGQDRRELKLGATAHLHSTSGHSTKSDTDCLHKSGHAVKSGTLLHRRPRLWALV